jgi:AcrR family transcriptional regulator
VSPRVTDEHKEGLKQRIIHAAIDHFSNDGYDGTKVDDIASSLKISKGSIYFYFGDKSGLFRAISDHFVERVKDELTSVFRTAEEMDLNVNQFYDNIRKIERSTDKLMIEMVAESTRNPQLRKAMLEHRRRVIEVTVQHLKAMREKGVLKKNTNVEAVAAGMMALYVGLTVSKLLGVNEEENKATWVEMANILREARTNV